MDPLAHLNTNQKQAVLTTQGPLLVLAGAGSGKTRVVVERTKHLIKSAVDPKNILAVTFTNKAAREMHERMARSIGYDIAKKLTLDLNYRSTQAILDCANTLIKANTKRYGKDLHAHKQTGKPATLVIFNEPEDEAKWVIEQIKEQQQTAKRAWTDFAILYRSNLQARPFEEMCRLHEVPYRVIGGSEFFDRKEIKDLLSYLWLVSNPKDELALRRIVNVPPRGFGPAALETVEEHKKLFKQDFLTTLKDVCGKQLLPEKTMQAIQQLLQLLDNCRLDLQQGIEAQDLARKLAEDSGLMQSLRESGSGNDAIARKRVGNIESLLAGIKAYLERRTGSTLDDYLLRVMLEHHDDNELETASESKVTLLTIHSAKGLEFPIVYAVGWEEGLLPHRRTLPGESRVTDVTDGDIHEERRLAYVAITRAQEEVTITRCRQRQKNGRMRPVVPSRFLSDIPQELLQVIDEGQNLNESKRQQAGAEINKILALLDQKSA